MGDSRECSQMGASDGLDDDSGLELSLGLSCGGFASKTKGKDALKETNSEQGVSDKVKNVKMSGDTCVKVGLCGNTGEEGNEVRQPSESVPPAQQNFWTNLGKTSKEHENTKELHMNQPQFPGFREPWFAGETSVQGQDMSANTQKAKTDQQQRQTILNQQHEGLEQEARKKRKMSVEEEKQQTKGEKEDDRNDPHCKTNSGIPSQLKNSPISANTQDTASPDNEDTADSEVEASSSRIVSPMVKYNMKQPMPAGSDLSDKKDNQTPVTHTPVTGSESNQEHSSAPFVSPIAMTSTSHPYSLQSFPVGHVPYNHNIVPSNPNVGFPPGFSLPYMMQFMPPTVNGADRSAVRPVNSSGFQMPLGYAPFQLPTLETSSPWVSVSHSHQLPTFGSKIVGGARMSADHADDESRISQAAVQAAQGAVGLRSAPLETAHQDSQNSESAKSLKDERSLERTGSDIGGTLSSKAVDDEAKHGVSWSKENGNHFPMADGLSQEVWNIRPGIAPGLKFGGTGNLPDLPWVSTTGRGPNGKTISGVMYRYNRTQVRIVCACHGRHMAPNEFVQHANDADVSNADNNVVGNSFPNGNQATSAQS
uniref:TSA: Wollemia nobilis Ref_Wollemi_Transcript_15145_2014 transcribed RNA sequence n=1 Tax=Wollemia nobilis TaxID=56998 RepID=A0A0C9RJ18_9CONI